MDIVHQLKHHGTQNYLFQQLLASSLPQFRFSVIAKTELLFYQVAQTQSSGFFLSFLTLQVVWSQLQSF